MIHNEASGVTFRCKNDEACIEELKKILSYLPSNNLETAPRD